MKLVPRTEVPQRGRSGLSPFLHRAVITHKAGDWAVVFSDGKRIPKPNPFQQFAEFGFRLKRADQIRRGNHPFKLVD